MSSLKFSVATRKNIRSSVTRIYNDHLNYHLYDDIKKQNVKLKLSSIQTELSSLDSKISELKFVESEDEIVLTAEMVDCEQYQDKIRESISLLTRVAPVRQDVLDTLRSLLKSPVAPLPRFSSAPNENLELFLRNFEETTSKFSYTQYDKLLLLKQQIIGKASILVDSLDVESQTYVEAKALLMAALASTPIQKFNVFKQLSEMKLTYSTEPFQYVSDMRKIIQAVKQLNITVDDVLQYFFFEGLNETFKNQLVLVTNNSKPSLNEILNKFFEANERYSNVQANYRNAKNISSSKSTSTLASNVSVPEMEPGCRVNPFVNCTLCSKNDHPINKCANFISSLDKLSRLEQLKGCTKCGNLDH